MGRLDIDHCRGMGRGRFHMVPQLLKTRAAVADFMAQVSDAPFLALDTETTGLDPLTSKLLLIQIGTAERQAVIDAQAVGPEVGVELLGHRQPVVLQHAKFDLKMLAAFGVEQKLLAEAEVVDTMLSEALLRNGRRTELSDGRLGLATLAQRYAGMTLDKSVRAGFQEAGSVQDLSEAELMYAGRDVIATWRVFAAQVPLLCEAALLRAAAIEGRACWAFSQMEGTGFPIASQQWRALVDARKQALEETRQMAHRAFDSVLERDLFGTQHLNLESDEIVLEKLRAMGLEVENTRATTLRALGHPAGDAVVAYREHAKIVSTYGDSFLEHVHPKSGRLHPDFRSTGASTGRASCSNPNLQNLPKGSDFRACFVAPAGRKLITADYAGAELRILAEMSRDPVFIRTFQADGDLHATVASEMFGCPVSKTTAPELRDRAKAINFGLIYGMGAGGLARQIGSTLEEAQSLLQRYFDRYPAIRAFLHRASAEAIEQGWATTLSGRRFWLTDLTRQGADRGAIERIARNMPIQGTNADMTKMAMTRISIAIAEQGYDAAIVNMVHDEIVVEAADDDAEAVRDLVVREMMSAGAEFIQTVPMTVEAKIDKAWAK